MLVEPLSPSFTVGESIDSVGNVSSLLMVPVPLLAVVDSVAPDDGLLSSITTVSSASTVMSPCTVTVIAWLLVPGENVSCPAVTAV